MLLHVTHTDGWDGCPYNDPDAGRETLGKAFAVIADSDVELVRARVDAPARTVFLVDADSSLQIEDALAPIIDVGWAETRPVGDLADTVARRTGGD